MGALLNTFYLYLLFVILSIIAPQRGVTKETSGPLRHSPLGALLPDSC